jgi:uncharacterized membrane protein
MKTVYKSLSWAVVSGIIIGTTAFIECGSLKTALVTALVASLLKTPFYSVHECMWNWDWKRNERTRTIQVEIVEPELEMECVT